MSEHVELVPVSKGVEYLEVHPSTLQAHVAMGWLQCQRRESSEGEPDGAKKASVVELRAALDAKGIAIPDGAKKADLQALLDGAA